MENIKNKGFLVKIPTVIYNEMQNNKELGYIDIIPFQAFKNINNPKLELHLNKNFPAQNFIINYNPTNYFFLFKDKKEKISKVKKIDYFGSCVAKDDFSSDNIIKKIKENNQKSVSTKRIFEYKDFDNEKNVIRKNKNKEKIQKTRMDKHLLIQEIFNMFSKSKYLNIKQISNQLQQPDAYLKEILNQICDYTTSGVNKGYYSLKNNYISNNN